MHRPPVPDAPPAHVGANRIDGNSDRVVFDKQANIAARHRAFMLRHRTKRDARSLAGE
jgi:hypothetical protein